MDISTLPHILQAYMGRVYASTHEGSLWVAVMQDKEKKQSAFAMEARHREAFIDTAAARYCDMSCTLDNTTMALFSVYRRGHSMATDSKCDLELVRANDSSFILTKLNAEGLGNKIREIMARPEFNEPCLNRNCRDVGSIAVFTCAGPTSLAIKKLPLVIHDQNGRVKPLAHLTALFLCAAASTKPKLLDQPYIVYITITGKHTDGYHSAWTHGYESWAAAFASLSELIIRGPWPGFCDSFADMNTLLNTPCTVSVNPFVMPGGGTADHHPERRMTPGMVVFVPCVAEVPLIMEEYINAHCTCLAHQEDSVPLFHVNFKDFARNVVVELRQVPVLLVGG
jgi:hypothetical protein